MNPEIETRDWLTMIIKTTRKCNLRCKYCHDWRTKSDSMPYSILARSIYFALQQDYCNSINFVWHGGEPLLLGRDYFLKALITQRELSKPEQRIINNIQTNATLIDEEWCQFFAKYNFQIGISLDGPPEIHNRKRIYKDREGSFQDVYRGIQLLKEHNISFGVIMVLTNETLELGAESLLSFLLEDLKIKNFSILPARPSNYNREDSKNNPNEEYVSLEKYSVFMSEMFDLWLEKDNPDIRIREIDNIVKVLLGGKSNVCTLSGDCIGNNFEVEPTGYIYHCDEFFGDDDYKLGNVLDDSMSDILGSDKLRKIIDAEKVELENLSSCFWFNFCKGGCPHDRYVIKKMFPERKNQCCGLDSLYNYIYQKLDSCMSHVG